MNESQKKTQLACRDKFAKSFLTNITGILKLFHEIKLRSVWTLTNSSVGIE